MGYVLFPQVLIRLAGVPFSALEGLGTPETVARCRALDALEAEARARGRALLVAARRLDPQPSKNVLERAGRRIQALRPLDDAALGPEAAAYEGARQALQTALTEAQQTLERELTESRRTLRARAAAHLPGFAVFAAELGDPELFGDARLKGTLPALNSKERQRERTYLMYLQRVAAKNDTISAYGPTAWGSISPDGPAMTLRAAEGIARRDAFYEKWVVSALAEAITQDPEARPELSPRLHPAGRWVAEGFLRTDTGQTVRLDPRQRALAEKIDGGTPAHALGAASALQELQAEGVILWEQEVVLLLAHRLEEVAQQIQTWRKGPARARWGQVCAVLLEVQARFVNSADLAERQALMERARALAQELGAKAKDDARTPLYRGATPLSEDCVRDVELVLGPQIPAAIAQDAAPWIDLWRDSYSLLAQELAGQLRPLVEETPRTAGKTLLPTFMAHCASKGLPIQGNGMLAMAAPAVNRIRDAFAEVTAHRADAPEWELTRAECHVVRDRLGVRPVQEFSLPAVDFMVGGRSLEAVNQGQFQAIIGEFHAPIVTLQHCFAWANPDPAGFARGLAASMGDFKMLHYGNVRVSATCHTSVDFHRSMPDRFKLASFQRGLAHWPVVPASEIEVFIDEASGDVRTRTLQGELLGSLARDWFVVWIAFHPFLFFRHPHLPRLRVGRCVVQRRTWVIDSSELSAGKFEGADPGLVRAVDRLRARHGVPRWVFLRPLPTFFERTLTGKDKDHKPVCIDLESYLGMEVVASWARKYPHLELTEMLPEPDELVWQERGGRYTFELRALVLDA